MINKLFQQGHQYALERMETMKCVKSLKKSFNNLLLKQKLVMCVFILPTIIGMYLFIWRPTILSFVWSFFRMRGYSILEFCGFDNYRKVITHTQFLPLIGNSLKYVFWSFIIGFWPPFVLAVMLNELVHGKSFFRVITYLPAVIPGIAATLMWNFIYYPDQTGLLNAFLAQFGIAPQKWLNDPNFAILGIVIYSTWKGLPGAMLLYFASLQSISVEMYEAALIDGAGPLKRFWNITRPSMDGILLLQLVQQIIGVFQTMEAPLAMTGGGPNGASNTIALQLYNYGFNSGGKATGQAMALGVIIFLILIVFTTFYFYLDKRIKTRY